MRRQTSDIGTLKYKYSSVRTVSLVRRVALRPGRKRWKTGLPRGGYPLILFRDSLLTELYPPWEYTQWVHLCASENPHDECRSRTAEAAGTLDAGSSRPGETLRRSRSAGSDARPGCPRHRQCSYR